jgi:hypothetical protein
VKGAAVEVADMVGVEAEGPMEAMVVVEEGMVAAAGVV